MLDNVKHMCYIVINLGMKGEKDGSLHYFDRVAYYWGDWDGLVCKVSFHTWVSMIRSPWGLAGDR